MRSISIFFIGLFVLQFLFSCNNSGGNNNMNKPLAISKANDLVVVSDNNIWKGEVGDTFRFYFETEFPVTPSPEPMFKLRHFTFEETEAQQIRRQLRAYTILVELSDTSSSITKMFKEDIGNNNSFDFTKKDYEIIYGKDKWARDQLIIYIAGRDKNSLIKAISEKYSFITEKLHQNDEKQIAESTFFGGENKLLVANAKQYLNINIRYPKDYLKALAEEKEKLIWGRKDTRNNTVLNFIVKQIEYRDTSQFSDKYLISQIDKFGKHVSTDTKGSVLVVNNKDLPTIRFDRTINGNQTLELRGIWEMTNDFMGGAFVSYLIKDKKSNNLVFALGFVYSPGNDKKHYLQQLMAIANTISFTN